MSGAGPNPPGGSRPPNLPDAVRQHLQNNPDALNELLHPETLERLARSTANADWCIACGASSGSAPAIEAINPERLTDEQIDALAERMRSRTRPG